MFESGGADPSLPVDSIVNFCTTEAGYDISPIDKVRLVEAAMEEWDKDRKRRWCGYVERMLEAFVRKYGLISNPLIVTDGINRYTSSVQTASVIAEVKEPSEMLWERLEILIADKAPAAAVIDTVIQECSNPNIALLGFHYCDIVRFIASALCSWRDHPSESLFVFEKLKLFFRDETLKLGVERDHPAWTAAQAAIDEINLGGQSKLNEKLSHEWIISHGNKFYSTGDSVPKAVPARFDALLQIFIGKGRIKTDVLKTRHSIQNPSRSFGELCKYGNGMFAPYVDRPGRTNTGYSIRVRRAE